jgi:prephenate dehydrogenase
MAYEVHFLGLNQTSTSIALALGKTEGEVVRTGFDPNRQAAKNALEIGAVEVTVSKPWKNIENADLVFLALPDELQDEFYEVIADELSDHAIVLDTSLVKNTSRALVRKYFKEDARVVGITPIVGIQALEDPMGALTPSPEYFAGGLCAITTSPDSTEDAIALAMNLAGVLGATPFFIDIDEHDAAISAVVDLPQLLELLCVNTNSHAPSWRELQRMAGAQFALSSAGLAQMYPKEMGHRWFSNKDKILDRLTATMKELDTLTTMFHDEDEERLVRYIEDALSAREAWLLTREKGDLEEQAAAPTGVSGRRNLITNLFGFSPRSPKDD